MSMAHCENHDDGDIFDLGKLEFSHVDYIVNLNFLYFGCYIPCVPNLETQKNSNSRFWLATRATVYKTTFMQICCFLGHSFAVIGTKMNLVFAILLNFKLQFFFHMI